MLKRDEEEEEGEAVVMEVVMERWWVMERELMECVWVGVWFQRESSRGVYVLDTGELR